MVVNSEKGMALVLTLMILVIITAMVVEFSYGVYTTTSALHNWEGAQRLSFVAKSGITMATKTISEYIHRNELYRYLGKEIPAQNALEDFEGNLIVKAEDENGKFNLNSLRNPASQTVFIKLLKNLGFNESAAESITGRIIDWIDVDSIPTFSLRDSEEGAKNLYMDSIDELMLIKGIDRSTYEKLLPYVTVYDYGGADDVRVNLNTASIPVIMSLGISREQAEEIVNYRKLEPFKTPGDLDKVGLDNIFRASISNLFTVYPPVNFRITTIAEENKIRRVIESIITIDGRGNATVRYWKEL